MNAVIANLVDVARRRGIAVSVRADGELVVVAPQREWALTDLLYRHEPAVVAEVLRQGLET